MRSPEAEQPSAGGAEALAPGGLRNVGEPDQHGPGAEAACRQSPQDVGEYRLEQVGRRRHAVDTLEGFERTGLGGQGVRQARDDFRVHVSPTTDSGCTSTIRCV